MKLSKGTIAVVTGAASGIGRALALDFARRGMHVVLADIERAPLERAAQEAAALGVDALPVVTDVTRPEAVDELARTTYERFGAAHVLCNNAGVLTAGPVYDVPLQDWKWTLDVNLWGVIHGVRAFVPRMLAGGAEGHIVNTASMAGLVPPDNQGVYNTSKYAVVGLTETLARDLRTTSIGVSMLCPGVVNTGIFTSERNRQPQYRTGARPVEVPKVPGLRVIDPSEVSATVLAGIEAGALFIFSHTEAMQWVERHHERVRRAFVG